MLKIGKHVYCVPDMCYGTIDQKANDRYYVEWDNPDMSEETGAWYYEDELRPNKKSFKGNNVQRVKSRNLTRKTLKPFSIRRLSSSGRPKRTR